MPDGILTPCNVARHWFRQVTAPCNVACGSGIVTANSSSGSTLQCDTWLWDDMLLNSPKRPPYWNSTSGFHIYTSPLSTCHSVPVCEILSKSDQPRQKKMTSCRFSRWRISAILDLRGPIIGSLISPRATSYRLSIDTVAVAKVLWTCVMQVLKKFRSYSVHVAPLETAGIFNVEMIPYCGQM